MINLRKEKTLILGLGNDILSDDAIGILMVRHISKVLFDSSVFEYKETPEMGLALLDYIEGYKNLVVVDSVITGAHPVGFVHELNINDFKGAGCTTPHFLGLKDTIEFGKTLGMLMPSNILIIGIEVENPYNVSEKLSAPLAEKFDDILMEVANKITSFVGFPVNV